MAKFISLFLKDLKFQVRIKNILSFTHTQENGIPHGSIITNTIYSGYHRSSQSNQAPNKTYFCKRSHYIQYMTAHSTNTLTKTL